MSKLNLFLKLVGYSDTSCKLTPSLVDFNKLWEANGLDTASVKSGSANILPATSISLLNTAKKTVFLLSTVNVTVNINGNDYDMVCPTVDTLIQPAIFLFTGTITSLAVTNHGANAGEISYLLAE